jgi:hypothetical protein
MLPKWVWCEEKDVPINNLSSRKSLRCPKCKKNINTFKRDCGDGYVIYRYIKGVGEKKIFKGCWHWYMSKHKRRLKASEIPK